MPAVTRRGPARSIAAPSPSNKILAEGLRRALRPAPPWTAIVPDPRLRRYYEGLADFPDARLYRNLYGEIPAELAAVNISEYLPTLPLLYLRAMHHHLCTDETRAVVVSPENIRGLLIERLIDVLATAHDAEAGNAPTDLPRRIARAAAGSQLPGPVDIDQLLERTTEPAWLLLFGATEWDLRARFRRSHRDLDAADRDPYLSARALGWEKYKREPTLAEISEINIARGIFPWADEPRHFLNWAWREHRRVLFSDFAPYGLDNRHWDLLAPGER
jgi:hypothetical protein